MRKFACLGVLLLVGCPASDDGGAGSGADWVCEPEFSGTWELVYETKGGTCGPLTTEIVNFDAEGGGDTGLVDEDCEMEATGDACGGRTIMSGCDAVFPDGTPARVERSIFLRQVSEDEATGSITLRVAIPGDVCSGNYGISGTRL